MVTQRHIAVLGLLILLVGFGPLAAGAEPITTGTLVDEMVDMVGLAEFPDPAYKTVQYSSYDRRSTVPGGPEWFANADGFGREPQPNFEAVLVEPNAQGIGEYLICDVQAPGAVVRTWTAAIDGTVRMYLDDAEEPFYDGPADEFLRQPYRRHAAAAGIDESLFEATFRQRDACYFPIPFAKRCRIVWIGNTQNIHFYEVQIRRYAPGTEVVTFQAKDLQTYRPAIERAAGILADPQGKWEYASSRAEVAIRATIPPRGSEEILALDGPAAIERLTLKVAAADRDRALRQTVLHVVCDDFPWGQVQSPVGDFFGAGPGVNPFNSVPLTVEPDGRMTCRYVMPFGRSCKIRLENRGSQPVTVTGSALPMDHEWDAAASMHFRARWRVDHDLVADGGAGAQDLPFLVAHGRGVYVGTTVMLMNPNPIPWPYGSWWGEGDEKIFVDDDLRPSTFGTGSEDYFNYSWSVPEIFGFPYGGQPRDDGPANRGFVVNQRWHVLDALPFSRRIGFYMELFSHERTPGFSYARLAYHYGGPGLTDDHVTITDEDVRHLELPAAWQPAARMGARGSTFHQAEDVAEGETPVSTVQDNLWAGGRLLVWQPTKQGDEWTFKLPVAEAGRHVIRVTAAHTPDSGRVSVRLDGRPIGFGDAEGIVDLATDYRTLSRSVSSQPTELTKGDHRLTLRCEDDSPDGKTVGIDFIWVQRQ
ncbi:MAG: DUF2961 domain-containing protein [Pirellulales bacterium]|nr:DUF2961 domain-containing protein [Pirellulales bacterium]